MTIGHRIKLLRKKLNISQIELAEKTNSSKQSIYKYENNIVANIPSDKIELIANALNTTPVYLMGWENEIDTTVNLPDLNLTDKEEKLIDDFRKLNKQGQEYILQTMDILKDKYKNDTINTSGLSDVK